MHFTDREVTLLVAALAGLSYEWEPVDPEIAAEAWELAREIADGHDVDPETAVRQLR
jgi:hypothetical protein